MINKIQENKSVEDAKRITGAAFTISGIPSLPGENVLLPKLYLKGHWTEYTSYTFEADTEGSGIYDIVVDKPKRRKFIHQQDIKTIDLRYPEQRVQTQINSV